MKNILTTLIDKIMGKKNKQPILVDTLRGNMHTLSQYMNYHPQYSFKLVGKYDDEYILEVYRR